MHRNIYFKGAGLMTATGTTVAEVAAAAARGTSKPSMIAIEQSDGLLQLPYFAITDPGIELGTDRLYQIIDHVIQQAITDAGLSAEQLQQAGLLVGSTSFDMYRCESALKTAPVTDKNIAIHTPPFNRLTHYIQKKFAIKGPVYTFNTACTASANALMYASEFIRRGDIDHALVLGLEFFNEVTALGFSSLELISADGMRPFDQQRDGLYLGEGCGALIISAEPQAEGFSYIAGANIGDHFSITASNPNGDIIQRVVERALSQAALQKDQIAIIKTHGTASLSNDEAESFGLSQAFGDSIPPIVALKPLMGHTLGACGINELILFMHSLSNQSIITFPSTIAENYPLRLATNDDIPEQGYYLLNYFGFGGNNTALVIANV